MLPLSGRAIAFMQRLVRARYHYGEETSAFAKTHLDAKLQDWVRNHDGDLAGVIESVQDDQVLARFLRWGGTPEERSDLRTRLLFPIARGLLRDSDPKFTSTPGRTDSADVLEVLAALEKELEGCGYERRGGDLIPRGTVLPAEAEQRTLFHDLLEQSGLVHAVEIAEHVARAEKRLAEGDLKGVGQAIRLATDRILQDIVSAAAAARTDTKNPGTGWMPMVEYLSARGALGPPGKTGPAEAAFLKGYYRFVSVEGSHTGIPADHDAASVLRLGYFVGTHLLEKHRDLAARGFADYPPD